MNLCHKTPSQARPITTRQKHQRHDGSNGDRRQGRAGARCSARPVGDRKSEEIANPGCPTRCSRTRLLDFTRDACRLRMSAANDRELSSGAGAAMLGSQAPIGTELLAGYSPYQVESRGKFAAVGHSRQIKQLLSPDFSYQEGGCALVIDFDIQPPCSDFRFQIHRAGIDGFVIVIADNHHHGVRPVAPKALENFAQGGVRRPALFGHRITRGTAQVAHGIDLIELQEDELRSPGLQCVES